jgi:hypothetical protein
MAHSQGGRLGHRIIAMKRVVSLQDNRRNPERKIWPQFQEAPERVDHYDFVARQQCLNGLLKALVIGFRLRQRIEIRGPIGLSNMVTSLEVTVTSQLVRQYGPSGSRKAAKENQVRTVNGRR